MSLPPFSEDALKSAVARSKCWADVQRLLGYEVKGANYRTVQRWVRRWEISVDHFDRDAVRWRAGRVRPSRIPLADVMVENSSYPRGKLKRRLFAAGIKQRRCELCGQGEYWRGRKMSLILDHINGIANDHRLENLQVVCPNCAATLETHCGRNVPRERVCPACQCAFAPNTMQHRYCSAQCWGTAAANLYTGVPRPERRKVPRPSEEELRRDLAEMSFVAVGRKYGVSDNTIRKWLRSYEHEVSRRVEVAEHELRRDEAA